MTRSRWFGLALLLDLVGAAAALLVSLRVWQVVTTPRPRPLADDVLSVSGRTLDAAPTALALVALAGVVAVLATRGTVRRVVGAVIGVAGVGLVWRATVSSGAVGAARAQELVRSAHPRVTFEPGVVSRVSTSPLWPWLTGAAGLLVLAGGALVAAQGHRWQGMSSRYERAGSPIVAERSDEDVARERTRHATTLWNALDRGEDPTTPAADGPEADHRTPDR